MFTDGHVVADYPRDRDAKPMITFIERAKRRFYVYLTDKAAFDAFVEQYSDKNIPIAIDLDPNNYTMSPFKSATFAVRDIYPGNVEYAITKTSYVIEGANPGDAYLLKLDGSDSNINIPIKYTLTMIKIIPLFLWKYRKLHEVIWLTSCGIAIK